MSDLKYFTLTGYAKTVIADNSDEDFDPETTGVYGRLTITPKILGYPVMRAEELTPPTLLVLGSISAVLDGGQIKLRSTQDDVRLVAKCSALNVGDASLTYTLTPSSVTAGGLSVSLPTIIFEAPTIADDWDDEVDGEVVIDLTTVEWLSTSAVSGGGYVIRHVPDDVQLVDGHLLQFYASGSAIGAPLDINDVIEGAAIHSDDEKTSLAAADEFPISDSEDDYGSKKVLWSTALGSVASASMSMSNKTLVSPTVSGTISGNPKLNNHGRTIQTLTSASSGTGSSTGDPYLMDADWPSITRIDGNNNSYFQSPSSGVTAGMQWTILKTGGSYSASIRTAGGSYIIGTVGVASGIRITALVDTPTVYADWYFETINYRSTYNAITISDSPSTLGYADAMAPATSGGGMTLWSGYGQQKMAAFTSVTSAVNYLKTTSAVTGSGPSLTATGTDSNINLNLATTGSGVVTINSVEAVTVSGTQSLSNKTLVAPTVTGMMTVTSGLLGGAGSFYLNGTAQPASTGTLRLHCSYALSDGQSMVSVTGNCMGNASGTAYGLYVTPTVTQSSTAGYSAFVVNPTETSTGSGSKLLADFQVGGVSKASIDDTGVITSGGSTVATASNTLTMTGKTLTSPTITSPKITNIYDSAGNLLINTVPNSGANGNYIKVWNAVAGAAPAIQAGTTTDANCDLLLATTGTGRVKINSVDAVDVSSAQSLSNKTIASPALSGTVSGTYTLGGTPTFSSTLTCTYGGVQSSRFNMGTNGGVELGRQDGTASNPFIDFNSGATVVDYDARIQVSGGTGSTSGGDLHIFSGTLQWNYSQIATASNTLTLTNKTISSPTLSGTVSGTYTLGGTPTITAPSISSPTISDEIIKDSNGNTILKLTPTAAATNYLTINNDATGGNPAILCQGSNSNISFTVLPKGNGAGLKIYTSTGNTAKVVAEGVDTNVDLNLTTKGSGVVTINSVAAVDVSSAQTLTSKTLTTPTMSSPKISDGIIKDANGATIVSLSATASANNYLSIANGFGTGPTLTPEGASGTINLNLRVKGTAGLISALDAASNTNFAIAGDGTNSTANYLKVSGASAGSGPSILATGSDSNIDLNLTTTGTGVVKLNSVDAVDVSSAQTLTSKTLTTPTMSSPKISDNLIKDSNGNTAISLSATAAAVTYLTVGNSSTTSMYLTPGGASADLGMKFHPKGAGILSFNDQNQLPILRTANGVASAVNYLTLTNAATGNAPSIAATGTDTDVDLSFTGQGTGKVVLTKPRITSGNAPASAAATGTAGQIEWDASGNIYLCVAEDTWVKTTLATW